MLLRYKWLYICVSSQFLLACLSQLNPEGGKLPPCTVHVCATNCFLLYMFTSLVLDLVNNRQNPS